MSTKPQRTLVVLCPDWPVTAKGGASDLPVAVVEGQRIVAASPAARAAGVRRGLRRRAANERCPLLVVWPRDHGGEVRAFVPVTAALEAFGATVLVRRPGWAAIATKGPARYFGGEEALAHRIVAALLALEVFAPDPSAEAGDGALIAPSFRVGIADGPFAATMAAEAGSVVASAETARFLAPLPVERLGRPELADLLRRLGCPTLGSFAALGEADVLARFGRDGARAHDLARGLDDRPSSVRPRELDRLVERVLDPPAERLDETTFLVRELAETLCARLDALGLVCVVLQVTVWTTEGEQYACRWSHEQAFSASFIVERVRWQLEAWLRVEEEEAEAEGFRGVERIGLVAEEIIDATGRQGELWGRAGAGNERVARALARVQGMLGVTGVLQGSLVGGRGPKEQVQLLPFGDAPPKEPPRADLPWPGRLPSPSPTVLLDEPFPVALVDAEGRSIRVDARGMLAAEPAALVLDGESLPVVSWAGPWPADERWWDAGTRRRRARFQLLLASGEAYLVALERGQCFLEGRYD